MLAFTLDQFRAINEAEEYDRCFRAQVEQGIIEADNPLTQWVGHEIVKLDMEQQKENLLERINNSN